MPSHYDFVNWNDSILNRTILLNAFVFLINNVVFATYLHIYIYIGRTSKRARWAAQLLLDAGWKNIFIYKQVCPNINDFFIHCLLRDVGTYTYMVCWN